MQLQIGVTQYRGWPEKKHCFNLFLANIPILYTMKILENQRFPKSTRKPKVFRENKMGILTRNGLKMCIFIATIIATKQPSE